MQERGSRGRCRGDLTGFASVALAGNRSQRRWRLGRRLRGTAASCVLDERGRRRDAFWLASRCDGDGDGTTTGTNDDSAGRRLRFRWATKALDECCGGAASPSSSATEEGTK
ncbi:unnamed protein product [Linum trigynum]|uniref:Uncharacterized protein n=1 Tax=Linum trigynum TaxID=586398 RepID=A0AAV2G9Q8_9ROSI